jgi:K+-transporting ATPase KdpF subunit
MSAELIAGSVVALTLLVYLCYALLRVEDL